MSTYVQVMVPEERLAAVYGLLGARDEAAPAVPSPAGPPAPGTTTRPWSDPTFVKKHLGPRSKTIRELAKFLAARPGKAITADEAAKALGLPYGWNSLAGALGALGNYLSNRGIDFPWAAVTDPGDERVRLTMDASTAAAVKQAL